MPRNNNFKEGRDPVIGIHITEDKDESDPRLKHIFLCKNCVDDLYDGVDEYIRTAPTARNSLIRNASRVHASDIINYRSNLFGSDEGHQGKYPSGLACNECDRDFGPINPKMN